jgi:hypothetical protein
MAIRRLPFLPLPIPTSDFRKPEVWNQEKPVCLTGFSDLQDLGFKETDWFYDYFYDHYCY